MQVASIGLDLASITCLLFYAAKHAESLAICHVCLSFCTLGEHCPLDETCNASIASSDCVLLPSVQSSMNWQEMKITIICYMHTGFPFAPCSGLQKLVI